MKQNIFFNKLESFNNEPEFKSALLEFFSSIDKKLLANPKYNEFLETILIPNNIISFNINWINNKGEKEYNKGYRVQYNNLNGVYKGGLRFDKSVNPSLLKMLAFEQVFKNSLTTLPLGGAKGGSDFDPKNRNEEDIKLFCYAFMKELYPYIGVDKDVPAGDLGVGAREIRYLYEAYKLYSGKTDCSLTGKPIDLGGSLCRKEATGYGLVYFANEALKKYMHTSFKNKKVIISGSGNVALYACKKAIENGAKVIAMSDSNNAIYVENGIDFETIRVLKEDQKKRIKEYKHLNDKIEIVNSNDIWKIKCDIALPCATQFEIDLEAAKALKENGVLGVFEGSNMSTTLDAVNYLKTNNILYSPGKASNAGGVAVSGLEIIQNVNNEKWSFEKVDKRLKKIMRSIFINSYKTAKKLGNKYDIFKGANNYAFLRIAEKFLSK